MEKTCYANTNQKKSGETILISDKVDFRAKHITGLFHNHKEVNSSTEHTLKCLPNNRTSKYMKQKLTELQGEMEKSIIIVEDSNILSSVITRINKINMDIKDSNNTTNQLDLITNLT